MRFINKRIDASIQFYYTITNQDKTFSEFSHELTNYGLSMQSIFERNIHDHYCDDILFANEVKCLVFRPDGNIVTLNESIYNQLKYYSKIVIEEFDNRYDHLCYEVNKIRNGKEPESIKQLAKLAYHDQPIISAYVNDKSILNLTIKKFNKPILHIFTLTDNTMETWSDIVKTHIIYEELIKVNEGFYQYNLLTIKRGDLSSNKLERYREVTINFSLLKIQK